MPSHNCKNNNNLVLEHWVHVEREDTPLFAGTVASPVCQVNGDRAKMRIVCSLFGMYVPFRGVSVSTSERPRSCY